MTYPFLSFAPKSARRAWLLSLPLCAVSLFGGALTMAVPTLAAPVAVAGDYRLGVGDELKITVSNHPDVNSEVVVRPDGKITLPRAGDVVASGKTAPNLAKEIERILARTLNNARVQVIVQQAAARQARIMGAVKTPNAYNIKPNFRVMDLVSIAGGLSTKASRTTGRIYRGSQVIPFDLEAAATNPGSKANLALLPDDLVQLDAQDFAKQLTVTGAVTTSGAFDLDENLTVTRLLAQAGGPAEGAALRRAYVLRQGKQVPLDLSSIASGRLSANSPLNTFAFQPGDVLVVPENTDRVNVMGQVARPASYLLPEDAAQTSILKIMAQAGGPTEGADLSNVSLTRTVNGEPTTTNVNVKAMRDGTAPDNVLLRPDDSLFVPKQDATVTVSGPVGTPGSYPLLEGETLLGLLSKTGTISKDAGLRNAYVLRDGVQIPIDLRPTLIEGAIDPKVAGFRLQRGDLIVIPDVSEQVTVTGAIAKPGLYSLTDDLTIVSLLARAGKETTDASLSDAYVIRQGINIPLDLNVFLSGATNQPSLTGFKLKPGDTLVIPENKVFYAVLGQVGRPGKFAYPDNPANASVLSAFINAGGPTAPGREGGADLADARIVRVVNGQATAIEVNLKDILDPRKGKGKTVQNVILQPGDLLYVPSKGKGFDLGTALGAASIYNIFR